MRSILVLLLFTYLPFKAHATSWRINNNVDRKAHFTDLNAAMKSMSVAEGDTLYLDPGCELPDSQSVTRKVCIIGTGYFLGSDTHESATIGGRLYLRSNGIKIEGAQVGGTTFLDGDHIKIERCKMGAIMVEGNAHYASVRQCYIEDGSVLCGSGRESQATYWTIENNIIRHSTGYDCVGYMNYPTIRNNYLCCAYRSSSIVSRITGGTITNNVIISLANHQYVFYQLSNCSVTNNILSASKDATYGANNKCLGSNQESTVFSPVFRASWPLKLNYPKNQAFSSEKLAILGVPR